MAVAAGVRAAEPTTPLRPGKALPITAGGLGGGLHGPLLCDSDGNLALVPAVLDARSRPMASDRVVRVAADGRSATTISRASIPGLDSRAELSLEAVAFDAAGALHVLVKGPADQFLASFASDGRYRSRTDVDYRHFAASSFAVFASGEFLVSGRSPETPTRGRLAVLGASGGLFDVVLPEAAPTAKPSRLTQLAYFDLAADEPAADGNVYYARPAPEGFVYAISPAGDIMSRFAIPSPRPKAGLAAIKVSGSRLAAIYREPGVEGEGMTSWVGVHDLASGSRLAAYGPVHNLILCYRSGGGVPDSFTLLGMSGAGQLQLIEASAP